MAREVMHESKKQLLMLFMHSLVKRALLLKYFSLGKPVVNTGMSGSEMMANILLTFMPAGVQVAFSLLKVGERGEHIMW